MTTHSYTASTDISEYSGCTCRTRNVLKCLEICAIIVPCFEKRRWNKSDHDGRATYLRGSGTHSQSVRVHSPNKIEDGRFGRDENRRAVAYHQRCVKYLSQQTQTSTGQKIKATRRWQLKSVVASDLIPYVFQAQGKRSSIATGARPKLIIDGIPKYRQSLPVYGRVAPARVRSPKGTHSMCTIPHYIRFTRFLLSCLFLGNEE